MPSATQELHDLMKDWFGDGISMDGPMQVLQSRGWTLTKDWTWKGAVPSQTVHDIDYQLVSFLVQEWDFGGFAE